MGRVTLVILTAALLIGSPEHVYLRAAAPAKAMSFHNRLLLNRLAVSGARTVEVMLAIASARLNAVSLRVRDLGGELRRVEPDIHYIRARIALDRVVELVATPDVEAYQIASVSIANWYSDARPESNAMPKRDAEERSVLPTPQPRPALPELPPEVARGSGFTADDDVGIARWRSEHPTFDGRGVTIAFMETALVEFGHPALQIAKTLDGRDVAKVVGVLNTIGPEDADETRVELSVLVRATQSWHRIDNRTFVMPHPGTYRFGLFSLPVAMGVVQRYAVLRDEATRDTWIDTDGDSDFRNETAIGDARTQMEVRHLRIRHPREATLAFVLGSSVHGDRVHVYTARSAHATMAISVAAGNESVDGLASGVAPGARVLAVRYFSPSGQFHTILEGYLDTIRRSDVDILCDSSGIGTVPDTDQVFASIFFRRLIATYRKPIIHSAGNAPRFLSNTSALGEVLAVGGAIGPSTFAHLYGGGVLDGTMVHPLSAAGPGIDGALKPDFLAPANRISAGVWIEDGATLVPKNAPAAYLPRGYEISCCTSASSPYAAGVAALLVSAAKQSAVPYSASTLGHALRTGARFLPHWPARQQGNGVLDVNMAWQELQAVEPPHDIRVSAETIHALTPYAPTRMGTGLFEQGGWKVGDRGYRVLRLTRDAGPAGPAVYALDWLGNDGTFSAPASVTLDRGKTTELRVSIIARSAGAHDAILNLHDGRTGRVVSRTEVAVVVAAPVPGTSHVTQFSGSMALLRSREHFLDMPTGVEAMSIELNVLHGALTATVLPPDGLYRGYYAHVQPAFGRTFTTGRYHFLWPTPSAGTWSIHLSNISALSEVNPALVSTEDASYTVTVRPFKASVSLATTAAGALATTVDNQLSPLREPELVVSHGIIRSHTVDSLASGLPNLFELDVPEGASSLRLELQSTSVADSGLELYLYDCTSGECFSWDFTLPARRTQTMTVRTPHPGRWIAAVNAAPFPAAPNRFTLREIIAISPIRRQSVGPAGRRAGRTSVTTSRVDPLGDAPLNYRAVLITELFDTAAQRDSAAHAWENRRGVTDLSGRAVALGSAIWPPE